MRTNSTIEKTINKTTKISSLIVAGIAIIGSLSAGYGVYYNSTSAIEGQANDIIEIKKDVVEINKKINKSDVFHGVTTAEYKALKDEVADIKKTVDNVDDKLDRVLIQTK